MKATFIVIASFVCAQALFAQSKIHFDLDYHYNLGLSQRFMGTTLKRDVYKMGGNSLHFTARYDISTQWSAGIGIGIDRYTKPDFNTLPLYATVRYKMVKQVPALYTFADLGYALKAGNKGFTGNLGIGYSHMLKKHFGFNFQIAYNLKNFESIPTYIYNIDSQQILYREENCLRHSLSFGIGLIF